MHPNKVDRSKITQLTDLPNVGKAVVRDLHLLGISTPEQLIGRCPFTMYEQLGAITGKFHDPCVIDLFMSITSFMDGEAPKPWWTYTAKRKQLVLQRNASKDVK